MVYTQLNPTNCNTLLNEKSHIFSPKEKKLINEKMPKTKQTGTEHALQLNERRMMTAPTSAPVNVSK